MVVVGYEFLKRNREGKKEKNRVVILKEPYKSTKSFSIQNTLKCLGKCGRWAANKVLICLGSNEFDIVACRGIECK